MHVAYACLNKEAYSELCFLPLLFSCNRPCLEVFHPCHVTHVITSLWLLGILPVKRHSSISGHAVRVCCNFCVNTLSNIFRLHVCYYVMLCYVMPGTARQSQSCDVIWNRPRHIMKIWTISEAKASRHNCRIPPQDWSSVFSSSMGLRSHWASP